MARRELIIPEYIEYLHQEHSRSHPIEVHHWLTKSKIGRNDFFVCCISPQKHYDIHHGSSSPQKFIQEVGLENLLYDSAIMFARWLGCLSTQYHPKFDTYVAMIKEIRKDPTNLSYVLATTRKYATEE